MLSVDLQSSASKRRVIRMPMNTGILDINTGIVYNPQWRWLMALDYPAVEARLNRWGLLGHLIKADQTKVSKDAAVLYARAICGPKTIVRVKRTARSWAYRHNQSVTLGCDRERRVKLSSVLHECAHILDYRKGKHGSSCHGEPFCRTYARLLREAV